MSSINIIRINFGFNDDAGPISFGNWEDVSKIDDISVVPADLQKIGLLQLASSFLVFNCSAQSKQRPSEFSGNSGSSLNTFRMP